MKQTQEEMILEHLESGQHIDPMEALNLYGVFRLAAIIHALKKRGYPIEKEIVRNGCKSYARYHMKFFGEGW